MPQEINSLSQLIVHDYDPEEASKLKRKIIREMLESGKDYPLEAVDLKPVDIDAKTLYSVREKEESDNGN